MNINATDLYFDYQNFNGIVFFKRLNFIQDAEREGAGHLMKGRGQDTCFFGFKLL